jgi:hypothetical protein
MPQLHAVETERVEVGVEGGRAVRALHHGHRTGESVLSHCRWRTLMGVAVARTLQLDPNQAKPRNEFRESI